MSATTHLLEQIRCQHEDFCVWPKRLNSAKVSNALLVVFWGGHDLEDVERRPRHVVAKHFEVYELKKRCRLQICSPVALSAKLVDAARLLLEYLVHDLPMS